MTDSILSPMRTTMNNFGQKQGHRMTPEQPHLLLGDVINTPILVHEESKETIITYLQYAGVKSQEDLSLLDKTDLPRSTAILNKARGKTTFLLRGRFGLRRKVWDVPDGMRILSEGGLNTNRKDRR